jgi:biopolymer transport protein ExbD
VLLVLVVMLILSIPIASHITQLNMPVKAQGPATPPPTVNIDIDYDGRVFWEGSAVTSEQQLEHWFASTREKNPQTVLRLWPDKRAPYERVAQVLAAAQRAHMKNLALAPIAD